MTTEWPVQASKQQQQQQQHLFKHDKKNSAKADVVVTGTSHAFRKKPLNQCGFRVLSPPGMTFNLLNFYVKTC